MLKYVVLLLTLATLVLVLHNLGMQRQNGVSAPHAAELPAALHAAAAKGGPRVVLTTTKQAREAEARKAAEVAAYQAGKLAARGMVESGGSLTKKVVKVQQKRTSVTIGVDGTLQYEVEEEGEHLESDAHESTCAGLEGPKRHECMTLVQIALETGHANWEKKEHWLSDAHADSRQVLPSHCHWFGVTCNELGHVAELYLARNNLAGTIPECIMWLPELTGLYLDSNALSGTIPDGLRWLTSLQQWQLSENQLSGTIPAWVGRIPHLKDLYLSKNAFEGALPEFRKARESVLREVSVDHNRLTGTIPPSLMQHVTLESLALSRNKLHGTIPDMSKLKNLESLHLENNALTAIAEGFYALPHDLFSSSECYLADNDFSCSDYPPCAAGACDDGACEDAVAAKGGDVYDKLGEADEPDN